VAAGEAQISLRFLVAVWRFWQTRGHLTEARLRADAILALDGLDSQPPDLLSRAFAAAGGISYWQGESSATHLFYKRALEEARRAGDRLLIAQSLYNFGFAPIDAPNQSRELYVAGKQYMEEALVIFEELGNKQGVADVNWALSIALVATKGDFDEAIVNAERAHQLYREIGNTFGAAWATYMVASLQVSRNRIDDVDRHLTEALDMFVAARDESGILLVLSLYAIVADRRNNRERFLRLGGAIERLREETGAGLADAPVEFLDYSLPEMPANPDEQRIWAEGKRLSAEDAVALVRETPE